MKVRMYNSGAYKNTSVIDDVVKITAMPEPQEITEEDIEYCDGIFLTLYRSGDQPTMLIPHSFLIEIIPD